METNRKDEIWNECFPKCSTLRETWRVAMEQYAKEYHDSEVKKLNIPAVIKSLPEYNEILYHARTLTDEQFREYWNDVQGNVL